MLRLLAVLLVVWGIQAHEVVQPKDLVQDGAEEAPQDDGSGGIFPPVLVPFLPESLKNFTAEQKHLLRRCAVTQTPQMLSVSPVKFLALAVNLTDQDFSLQSIKLIPTVGGVDVSGAVACSAIPDAHFCSIWLKEYAVSSACLATECSRGDFEKLVASLISPVLRTHCSDDDELPPLSDDPPAKAMTAILCILAFLSLVGTAGTMLREWCQERNANSEEKHPLVDSTEPEEVPAFRKHTEGTVSHVTGQLMACWDLRRAWNGFMKVTKRNTDFLNGIRVISITWVVMGHTLVYPREPGFENQSQLQNYTNNFRFVLVSSGVLAVDTFFYLSGFLGAFILVRSWPRNFGVTQNLKRMGLAYLDRFVRLTPLYAVCLFFGAYLLQHMGSGPLWSAMGRGGEIGSNCPKYWWRNLLYINSFFGEEELCFGHSWYLSNDMIFFIVGLVPIVLNVYTPRVSWACTGAIFTASIITIAVRDHHGKESFGNSSDYFHPYIRAPPYFLGIMVGFLMNTTYFKNTAPSFFSRWWVRAVAYLVAFVIMFGLVVLTWDAVSKLNPENGWSDVATGFYAVHYHFSWGIGLGILTCVWSQGHGGLIRKFLSLPFWEPLGRLTYGTYLIHPMALALVRGTSSTNQYYTDIWFLSTWTAAVVGSYLAAMLTMLFIEAPSGAMWDLISGRTERRKAVPKEDKGLVVQNDA